MPDPVRGWTLALLVQGARTCLTTLLVAGLLSADEGPHAVSPAEQLAIRRADTIMVLGGGPPYSPVYSSTNPKEISELRTVVAIEPPRGWFRCACFPELEVTLSRKGKELGVIAIQENLTIGFSRWSGDAVAASQKSLLKWFDARGINGPRRSYERKLASEKADRLASKRWLSAMPSSLRPLWPKLMQDRDWYNSSVDSATENAANALAPALTKQFPDDGQRIRALFSWFGSGAGPWSGFPADEEVPARLLLRHTPRELLSTLEASALNDSEMEGAARFFSGYSYEAPFVRAITKDRRLIAAMPADLRQALMRHVLKTGDHDNIERARRAFEKN